MENKLIAKGITTDLNSYTFSGIKTDEPIIVITEDGFKYKGELIEDKGEIYELFKNYLTSYQSEISDEEIEKWAKEYTCKEYEKLIFDYENYDEYRDFVNGAKKYREQLKLKCKHCLRPMDVNFLEYSSNSYCNLCFDERADSKNTDESRLNTFEFMGDVIPLEQEATSSQTTSDKWKEYQDWLNEVPEISDEEIEKAAEQKYPYNELRDGEFKGMLISAKKNAWVDAIKWYKEQLNKL